MSIILRLMAYCGLLKGETRPSWPLPSQQRPRPIPVAPPPILDEHKTIVASADQGARAVSIALGDVSWRWPSWARHVEVPACVDAEELDAVLHRLAGQSSITSLTLRRPPREVTDLGALARFRELERLAIGTDWDYLPCRAHTTRRSAALDLVPLANLGQLQALTLRGPAIGGLEPLARLTTLRELDLSGAVRDLGPLRPLQRLERLVVHSSCLRSLAPVAELRRLRALDVGWSRARELSPLRALRHLKTLVLSGTRVADVEPLAGLPALEHLDLAATKVTDLRPLASLPRLRALDLALTAVSDVTPLSECRGLETLDLHGTRVADLSPLATLPVLRDLSVAQTSIQQWQLRELRLPDTRVEGLRIRPGTAPALAESEPVEDEWLESYAPADANALPPAGMLLAATEPLPPPPLELPDEQQAGVAEVGRPPPGDPRGARRRPRRAPRATASSGVPVKHIADRPGDHLRTRRR